MFPVAAAVEPATAWDTIDAKADVHLVNQVREQNEAALVELYRRYGTLVYSIALRTLDNVQDAEEVTQDVFLQLWEKGDQFDRSRGTFIAWLTTCARNAAIDRLRKRRRREPAQGTISLEDSPQVWELLEVETPDDELRFSIAAAVRRLSPAQQEAILLAYFYGLSQDEIAKKLRRPLGTVKSHIRQGMDRLRQIWLSQEA